MPLIGSDIHRLCAVTNPKDRTPINTSQVVLHQVGWYFSKPTKPTFVQSELLKDNLKNPVVGCNVAEMGCY